eukprot:ANDGO_00740.mRNA.1 Checkpoint protein rad17
MRKPPRGKRKLVDSDEEEDKDGNGHGSGGDRDGTSMSAALNEGAGSHAGGTVATTSGRRKRTAITASGACGNNQNEDFESDDVSYQESASSLKKKKKNSSLKEKETGQTRHPSASGWKTADHGPIPTMSLKQLVFGARKSASSLSPLSSFQSSQSLAFSSSKSTKKRTLMIAENYEPSHSSDLCVHSAKVNEIRSWMLNAASTSPLNPHLRVLVLLGPSGCGKTTVVRVLCSELGLQFREMPQEFDSSVSSREFLRHVTKDLSNRSNGENRMSEKCSRRESVPSLLMVDFEDFHLRFGTGPPSSTATEESFSSWFLAIQRIAVSMPVVIAVNTSSGLADSSSTRNSGRFESRAQASAQTVHSMSTPQAWSRVKASTISMNPIAPSFVKKALERLISVSGASRPNLDSLVQKLSACCGGDLRLAIRQFEIGIAGEKDDLLDIFHATGKLLYGKAEENIFSLPGRVQLYGGIVGNSRPSLNSDRMSATTAESMDNVVFRTIGSAQSSLLAWSHANFTEFVTSLDDIEMIGDHFSLADTFLGSAFLHPLHEDLGFAIASLGLRVLNRSRVHPGHLYKMRPPSGTKGKIASTRMISSPWWYAPLRVAHTLQAPEGFAGAFSSNSATEVSGCFRASVVDELEETIDDDSSDENEPPRFP